MREANATRANAWRKNLNTSSRRTPGPIASVAGNAEGVGRLRRYVPNPQHRWLWSAFAGRTRGKWVATRHSLNAASGTSSSPRRRSSASAPARDRERRCRRLPDRASRRTNRCRREGVSRSADRRYRRPPRTRRRRRPSITRTMCCNSRRRRLRRVRGGRRYLRSADRETPFTTTIYSSGGSRDPEDAYNRLSRFASRSPKRCCAGAGCWMWPEAA